MIPTRPVSALPRSESLAGHLILAPLGSSAPRSAWMKCLRSPQGAFASGWGAVRGARRRRDYERGFVLSDHADWNGPLATGKDRAAGVVFLTHGQTDGLAR